MRTTTGFTPLPEGRLFWRYDTPDSPSTTTPDQHKPLLLFLHAAIADHTQWDPQTTYLTSQGYSCLRYDRLGYGLSTLSDEYLSQQPAEKRAPVAHYEHPGVVLTDLQQMVFGESGRGRECAVVLVGLSMGAFTALDYAFLEHPPSSDQSQVRVRVRGVLLCSGGVSGFEEPPMSESDRRLFQHYDALIERSRRGGSDDRDREREDALSLAAEMQVRIWGDGLQAPDGEGRLQLQNSGLRAQMLAWCRDIAERESRQSGGFAIPMKELRPTAVERLREGDDGLLKGMKIRMAFGKYDDRGTIAAMRWVNQVVNDGHAETMMEFKDAAHLCNLEEQEFFNSWVKGFLDEVGG